MSELAQAYVQVIPTTNGIKGMLTRSMAGEGSAAGKAAGAKLATGLKVAVAAAGIGKVISSAINVGASVEQSVGGIKTIFKGSADIVLANAQKAASTLQISADSYMQQATSFSASLLQSLGNDTKAAATVADMAISDMSDNANKMGTNIQDIQNAYQGFAKQNYTMLDNLKLGYGGTKTEMERLLSEASKISGQKYDISNLADVYNAIHVIQGEMDITGTSSAEAATTLSGSLNAMKASANNFMASLTQGDDISMNQALSSLIKTTNTYFFDNLLPSIGSIFKTLPNAMGQFIQEGVPALITKVKATLTSLGTAMKGSGDVFKRALSGMLDLSNLILANSGGLIKAGLRILQNLAQGIVDALPTLIATVPKIISNFANVINNNAPTVLAAGLRIMKTLAVGIIKAIPTLIKSIPAILKAMWDVFTAMQWESLGASLVKSIKKGITMGFSGLAAAIKAKLSIGIDGAKTMALAKCQAACYAVRNVFANVGKFIAAPFRTALSTVIELVTNIKSAINFASVATNVRMAFTAVKNAITNPIQTAKKLLSAYIKAIKNMFPFNLGKILRLKIPRISVSGGKAPWGIAGKGKTPSFNVTWAAKGGIVDGATLIGAGEAGAEGIVPLTPFWNRLDSTLAAMSQTKGTSGGTVTLILNLDSKTIAQSTIDYVNNQTVMMGTNPLTV